MSVLPVEDLKGHLAITDMADDALLASLIEAAEDWLNLWLPTPLADLAPVPNDLKQAVKMLVGHWYENREATLVGTTAQNVPLGLWDILNQHRDYGFGA